MRGIKMKCTRRLEEDVTPGSSFASLGSYDVFGAVCSDSSDDADADDGEYFLGETNSGTHSNHNNSTMRSLTLSNGQGIRATMETSADASTPLLASKNTLRLDLERDYGRRPDFLDSMNNDVKFSSNPNKADADKKSEKRQQSSIVTVFAVWNTIMGSSLLTMAWGVERAGLWAALALMVLMGALCLYTAYVLLKVREHHGASTSWEVHDLCRVLLGRWAEVVAQGFSLLVMLGANIVYWILMTNFLYYTVNYFMDLYSSNATEYRNSTLVCPKEFRYNISLMLPVPPVEESPYWGLHSTVPLFIALLVFPLLNFKKATFFTKFNSLGTLSVLYLLVFVMVKGWRWGVHVTSWPGELRAGRDVAVLSGMLALSFYIHNIIITIMSQNANQKNNGRDLTISFVLVTLTYILVGAVFYICFPLAKYCIEDNILNNFEMHDGMSAAARILLLFQVITVYPLIAYMFRTQTLNLLPLRNKSHTGWVVTLNIAIVAVCILFACFCPNIGTIVRYTGAVSGLVHIFTLPSLLQVRSLQLRGRLVWWKTTFYSLITLIGAVNLFAQFFINE